jgi:hydroxymethylpyrimidine/phosphomethylpyrimidine kinase
VKVGMLSNAGIIEVVAAKILEYRVSSLVVDPVMMAKGGDALLKAEARDCLIEKLLPLASVLTPNLPEAEALCGFKIGNPEDARAAARAIRALGPKAVVVKGGHFSGSGESRDLLFDGEGFAEFAAPRIASKNTHGTGCTFASATAANLALGLPLREAVAAAKDYVTAIIGASVDLGLGAGFGPMNHVALLRRA